MRDNEGSEFTEVSVFHIVAEILGITLVCLSTA